MCTSAIADRHLTPRSGAYKKSLRSLGGTLVQGMIGLVVGPIVLSIAWQLLVV